MRSISERRGSRFHGNIIGQWTGRASMLGRCTLVFARRVRRSVMFSVITVTDINTVKLWQIGAAHRSGSRLIACARAGLPPV